MKSKLTLLWIYGVFFVAAVSAQNNTQTIVGYQYYYDTDPGVGVTGNGAIVSITPTADFNQNVSIVLPNTLSEGMHILYVRMMDEYGHWSLAEHSTLFIQPNNQSQTVIGYQYYFDMDPGIGVTGNGAIVSISPTADFNQNVTIILPNSLSEGTHDLYVRTQNESGRWSIAERNVLAVHTSANNQITAGEYFIENDPGPGNGIFIPVPQIGNTVDMTINVPVPDTFMQCTQQLYARFKNADNSWSIAERVIFNNPHKHARVFFNPIVSANTVYFEIDTQHVSSVNWNFDDGGTASVFNPLHSYAQAGSYNVRLIGSNPLCANDTIIRPVVIAGVRHLECRTGCNNGTLTVNVNGGAFTAVSTVKFKKTGFPDIVPVSLQFVNNTLMIAKFNLNGSPAGLRDLEVSIPAVGVFTLANEFDVTAGCNDSLALAYEGTERYRFNPHIGASHVPAYFRVINKAAKDAVGVTVLWRTRNNITNEIIGSGMSSLVGISFFNNAFQYFSNNGINTSVMDFHLPDDTTHSRLSGIMIPKIKANSSVLVPLNIYASSLAVNAMVFGAFKPVLFSDASASNIAVNLKQDYRPFMRFGIERVLGILVDSGQFNACYNQAFDTLLSIIGNNSTAGLNISFNAALSAILVKISSSGCVANVPANLSNTQFNNILRQTMSNIFFGDVNATNGLRPNGDLKSDIHDATVNSTYQRDQDDDDVCKIINADLGSARGEALANFFGVHAGGGSSAGSGAGPVRKICTSGSADPNQKYGPGDNPDKIWLHTKNDKAYTIEFENMASASAPAQTVCVYDTLDSAKMDLASFRWGSVAIGENIFIDLSDVVDTTVIRIVDLQPAINNKLLIVGTYSPSTGIIVWKMYTVDLINLQPTTNSLEGFLPPNTAGQGVGFVSYKVNYKSGLATGDDITNKSTILFDENAPINTNTYLNRYDDVKPQSAVSSLPLTTAVDTFQVSWSGSDLNSGIGEYLIFVSNNDGPYAFWKSTDSTYGYYFGINNHKYEFYSLAIDQAGNLEDAPENVEAIPDAVTTLNIPVSFQLKVFIEGLYMGNGFMQPMLFNNNLSVDSTASDSLFIELRDHLNPDNIVFTVRTIVHSNGKANMVFPAVAYNHSYYFTIHHHNAIETWSKEAILINSTRMEYDFTRN